MPVQPAVFITAERLLRSPRPKRRPPRRISIYSFQAGKAGHILDITLRADSLISETKTDIRVFSKRLKLVSAVSDVALA
jgi:hypothetical protein